MTTRTDVPDFGVVPSKIDENAEISCPFFVGEEKTFSSVYGKQHAQATVYLTVKLQNRFDNVLIEGEAPLSSGVRGFLDLKFVLKNSRILVEGHSRVLCALEVKTGAVKICQPAYYACVEGVPVLLVETKTGDVFVISPGAGKEYLKIIEDLFREKSILESRGIYCPSRDNCRFCANHDCEHLGNGFKQKMQPSTLLDDNLGAFAKNLPVIVEKISVFVEGLLEEQIEGTEAPSQTLPGVAEGEE